MECPQNCHGNGDCLSGLCHCFPGFLGPDCSRGKQTHTQTVPPTERQSMLGGGYLSSECDLHTFLLSLTPSAPTSSFCSCFSLAPAQLKFYVTVTNDCIQGVIELFVIHGHGRLLNLSYTPNVAFFMTICFSHGAGTVDFD